MEVTHAAASYTSRDEGKFVDLPVLLVLWKPETDFVAERGHVVAEESTVAIDAQLRRIPPPSLHVDGAHERVAGWRLSTPIADLEQATTISARFPAALGAEPIPELTQWTMPIGGVIRDWGNFNRESITLMTAEPSRQYTVEELDLHLSAAGASDEHTETLNRIQAAHAAVGELADLDRGIRAEHAAALLERRRLFELPEPINAIVANAHRLVDEQAAHFAKESRVSVLLAFTGGLRETREGKSEVRRPQLWDPPWPGFRFRDLCGLAPELVKARVTEVIRAAAADVDTGLPIAERPTAIATIDARIRELEERHTELVDGAARLTPPIALELLPAVKTRRDAEEQQRRRDAHRLQAQREAEAQVNASRAAQPRAQPSEYIAGLQRPRT